MTALTAATDAATAANRRYKAASAAAARSNARRANNFHASIKKQYGSQRRGLIDS
jgi:hypothetical protein